MPKFTAAGRIDTHKSTIQAFGPTQYSVQLIWSGSVPIDRSETYSISCGSNYPLAERLKAAIDGQKAFTNPTLTSDRHGKTYVKSDLQVMGRTMERDLARLGY